MANLSEQESWIDGIYQLETSDPVVAGPGGISNRQAEQLASRTAYLKKMQETTGASVQKHLVDSDPHSQYAPKNSPALTGTPTAPTTAQTANNTQIATTAFVKSAIAALVNGSPATLDTLQELAKALGNDPNFSTTVLSAIADVKAEAANKLNTHASSLDAHPQYAPKVSPTFTGKPTAPTAALTTNDTQLATTAFVKAAVTALVNGSPAALDTLQELANALGNDPNFSTTILDKLAQKLEKEQNGADIPDKAKFLANIGLKSAATRTVGIGVSDIPDITIGDNRYLGKTTTAVAATKLAAAKKIAGVLFDGTADIALMPENIGALPATGTAIAATKLAVARTINGIAFDGSANISLTPASVGALPAAGTAAAATKLATARTINDIAFDGTANISLTPASVGALPAAGTAAAATKLATARTINGIAFDGTANISLTPANVGALPAAGTAAAATKLATPRKINGVAFDGTTDIDVNLGIKMKAFGQYSPMNAIGVEFTAVNANTLRCYITRQDQGFYVELGVTKMVLVDVTLTDVISAPYVRRRFIGSFPVTKITMDAGLNASNGMWEINYPGHGVAVGSRKSFYIMGLVYREVGMKAIGQVAEIDGLQYQMNVELDNPVSNIRAPIIAYAESEIDSYIGLPIPVYGRKNFANQRFTAIPHADLMDERHLSICASDNNMDNIIRTPMVTVMVYDF